MMNFILTKNHNEGEYIDLFINFIQDIWRINKFLGVYVIVTCLKK